MEIVWRTVVSTSGNTFYIVPDFSAPTHTSNSTLLISINRLGRGMKPFTFAFSSCNNPCKCSVVGISVPFEFMYHSDDQQTLLATSK